MAALHNPIATPEATARRGRAEGVVFVHSAPRALAPHVEWAVSRVLGEGVSFDWSAQPTHRGSLRADFTWHGDTGTGAALTSALRAWGELRFEVTQQPTATTDGSRWMVTPELGVFHAGMDTAGGLVIAEERLRDALAIAGLDAGALQRELGAVLGRAWDDELEPFRSAGEGNPVVYLGSAG